MKKAIAILGSVLMSWCASAQIVQDGDMESADTNAWLDWGAPLVKAKEFDAERGSTVLHVATGGVQQLNLPVTAGAEYTLRLSAKVKTGTLRVLLGIQDSNSDFEGRFYELGVANYGDWNSMERRFTVPAGFTHDFRLALIASAGEAWVDDVTITAGQDTRIVLDGDMEGSQFGQWWCWGTPELKEKSAADPRGGAQSLHFRTFSGTNWIANRSGLQQRFVPVATGRWYRLSFWYRVASGTLCPRLGHNDSNNDYQFGLAEFPVLAATDGEWRFYERAFKTPDAITGDFRLVLPLNPYNYLTKTTNEFAEAEVDDLVIEPFDEKREIIPDMDIALAGSEGLFQWPVTNGLVYSLEYTTNLTPGSVWRAVRNYGGVPGFDGHCSATVDVSKVLTGYSNFFFRLRAQ